MSNAINTRRKYTKEFKLKVVREYLEGQTLSQLSRLYGISTSTLGTWFTTFKDEVEAEVKSEVVETREEILEKALEGLDRREDVGEVVVATVSSTSGAVVDKKALELAEKDAEIERLNKIVDQQQNVIEMLKSQLNAFGEKDKEILEVATTLLRLVYNR